MILAPVSKKEKILLIMSSTCLWCDFCLRCLAAGSLAVSVTDMTAPVVGSSGGVYALVSAHLANVVMVIGKSLYSYNGSDKFQGTRSNWSTNQWHG